MIPELPIWMDTPTPICLGTLLRIHPDSIARGLEANRQQGGPFDQSLVRIAAREGDRAKLDTFEGPVIIVAPSEMGDNGRAAHHLRRCLPDARHLVILLSFHEEGSVGHQLEAGASEVIIEGTAVPVRATVEKMPAYSGHADSEELRGWIRSLQGPVKRAFVVHGDDLSVSMMVTILREEGCATSSFRAKGAFPSETATENGRWFSVPP